MVLYLLKNMNIAFSDPVGTLLVVVIDYLSMYYDYSIFNEYIIFSPKFFILTPAGY